MTRTSSDHTDSNKQNSPRTGSTTPGRASIVLLLIVVLLTTFLAIRFIDLPGSSEEDDTPILLAQTGCFDMDLLPAGHEPPVSLDQAEADARALANEVEPVTGDGPDQENDIGELVWADYGELAPGTAGRVASGHAWVLVFELEQDASWWRRLTIQDADYLFSVIYRPEPGEISAACSSEAP